MNKAYFEILRAGVNTTIQDKGRNHLYHIGIAVSGAIDQRNYILSNKLVGNNLNEAAIEFAYQGPLLKLKNGKINLSITGDVLFKIIRKNSNIENGICYKSYILEDEDQIDLISTKNTAYGYLSISGGFELEKTWNSYSINTKANVGPNNGKKYSLKDKIFIKDYDLHKVKETKMNYREIPDNTIRVIKGTNFDYFSNEGKKIFFEKEFIVSKLSDRMGMRLEGLKIENIVNTNIKSEGLLKGVIQVPADGNPIIMLSDHGTIGGYPKIGVVASVDYDRLVQISPGSKIKFRAIELSDAETLFKLYEMETQNLISQI